MALPAAWARAADRIDPPPPGPDLATPVAFMDAHSRGLYRSARHLEAIQTAVLDAIRRGGRTIISVSVRHGKTILCSRWLPAWYIGTHPDRRVLHATNTAELGRRNSRAARDILTEHGHRFGVSVSRVSAAADIWDLEGHPGGMQSVGVGGTPIGAGGNLVIVDDPYKSWADAMSYTTREAVIEWWTGTMESRIEPGGAVVIVMARWHPDDLAGFLLREAPDEWREVRLPAVATDGPDTDPLGRQVGEALWPERYPLSELERRKTAVSLALGPQVWDAQFQQQPSPPGGDMFPEDRWGTIPIGDVPAGTRWVRGWDLASTEGGGDWTVGVRVGIMPDGRTVIADVTRGQWGPDQVRAQLTGTAAIDGTGTHIELPQDPGQAGKDQAQQLVRLLAGYSAQALPQTGSKEVRATPLSAQVKAENVLLVADGAWRQQFISELAAFPRGQHDDQVDAVATAYNAAVRGSAVAVEVEEWTDRRPLHRRR